MSGRYVVIVLVFLLGTFGCLSHQRKDREERVDVTIVGYVLFANGLGRTTIAALDYLQDEVKVNFKNTRPEITSFQDVPEKVRKLVLKNNHAPSNVAIIHDNLILPHAQHYKKMPESKIKLAYSMIETTAIPDEWASIINNYFDGVVVPDPFLIEVYKNSGVKKPIFSIPLPVYMDEFLAEPLKKKPNDVFVFGVSCAFSNNKNCELLMEAFAREFGNSLKVRLSLHSPWNNYADKIHNKLKELKVSNIEISCESLPWHEYVRYMKGLDCYVLISKGEGFSFTPREALALGIPCILSNNTAHKTICNTGYVYGVKADIVEKHPGEFFGVSCGYNFNCRVEDVQRALREVYSNYEKYLAKAHEGREWVKQYHGNNLKKRYRNLFKPIKVLLGNENLVTENFLMTTSESLYHKYLSLASP